jgi:hypothetical protein
MANNFLSYKELFPDFKFIQNNNENGSVNIVVKTRNYPGDSLAVNSTSAIQASTQQSFIRGRARQMVLKI